MQAPPSLAYSFSGLHILMPGRRHVRHDPRREPHSHEKVVDTAGGGQADGKDVGGAGGDVKSGAVEDPVEKGERGPRAPHKRAGRVKEPGSCEANPDR